MTNKYNARKVSMDGYTFDSQSEARRYQELKLLEKSGDIKLLEIHKRFLIIEGFTWNGKRVRPTYYECDFFYWDNHKGRMVVEDVKAFDKKTQKFITTAVFNLKLKLFKSQYPQHDFVIVEA
jgi:hypothetical protein